MTTDTTGKQLRDAAADRRDAEPDAQPDAGHGDERPAAVAGPTAPRRHTEVVDVHLILLRGRDVLLARRANTGYADGLLHAPSGHLEDGEDVRAGMIREAGEEIGIDLAPHEVEAAVVMQHRGPGGCSYGCQAAGAGVV